MDERVLEKLKVLAESGQVRCILRFQRNVAKEQERRDRKCGRVGHLS